MYILTCNRQATLYKAAMTQLQTIINLLQSIDDRLATRQRIIYSRPPPSSPLPDRLLSLIAKGGILACYSTLIRRGSRDGSDAVDSALAALEDAKQIVRIRGKHGFRYELVSHTPTESDASPLVTDASPV